jgi:hypothetical protein
MSPFCPRQNLQARDTNAKATAYITEKIDTFVNSNGVFDKIFEHGIWHSPERIATTHGLVYLYGGNWGW